MVENAAFTVDVTRAGVVESQHTVHAVIADRHGTLRHWGDRRRPTIARSAIKSIQALPLVMTGAAVAFDVSEEEVALACASHSGEEAHVDAVAAWLARIGLAESDLECGADRPLGAAARRAFVASGAPLRPLLNGCSGKHAGFLTVARHLGVSTVGYIERDAEPQRRVAAVVEHMTGLVLAERRTGIDGCGIPVHVLPLERLAFAMARLVDPVDLAEEVAAAAPVVVAAAQRGFWVAGTGRTESWVQGHAAQPVVVKTGAEGVFMAALPAQGLGIALKVADGTSRASRVAIKAVLAELDVLTGDNGRGPSPLRNKAGTVVGEIVASFTSPASARLDSA